MVFTPHLHLSPRTRMVFKHPAILHRNIMHQYGASLCPHYANALCWCIPHYEMQYHNAEAPMWCIVCERSLTSPLWCIGSAPIWCMALLWCIGGVVKKQHPEKIDPHGLGPGAPQTLSFYIFCTEKTYPVTFFIFL